MTHRLLSLLLHDTLSCLPITAPLWCLAALSRLLLYRCRAEPAPAALRMTTRDMLAISSVAGILFLTLLPMGHRHATVSLVPLTDLRRIVTSGSHIGTFRAEAVSNLALFLPFGLFVPRAIHPLNSAKRIVLLAAGFSIVIETLQFLLPLSRTTSTDDVLLNTTGAALGFLLLRALRRSLVSDARLLRRLNARILRSSVGPAASSSQGEQASHPF